MTITESAPQYALTAQAQMQTFSERFMQDNGDLLGEGVGVVAMIGLAADMTIVPLDEPNVCLQTVTFDARRSEANGNFTWQLTDVQANGRVVSTIDTGTPVARQAQVDAQGRIQQQHNSSELFVSTAPSKLFVLLAVGRCKKTLPN